MLAALLYVKIAKEERQLQLLLRAIAKGVVSERDRLLGYTIGEVYQELSLFIEEGELRQRALEKSLKTK